jgi:hypothetical protein
MNSGAYPRATIRVVDRRTIFGFIRRDVSPPTFSEAPGNVGVAMDVLLADVNSSQDVNSGDVFLVQQQNGQSLPPTGSANYRRDINVNGGSIDSGDVFIAQKQNPSQHVRNTTGFERNCTDSGGKIQPFFPKIRLKL